MTKKELNFCYKFAEFMVYPLAIAIGEASYNLKNIIREITIGNRKYREKVFEFIEMFVIDDNHYDKHLYGEFIEDALKTIKEDYDAAFFNIK